MDGRRDEMMMIYRKSLAIIFNIPIVANNVPLIRLASGSKTKRGF